MDRKGSMFDKPGSSDRSCSQTSNLQKKWTFDYWSDFAAPPIPWDLKCTDPNSIFVEWLQHEMHQVVSFQSSTNVSHKGATQEPNQYFESVHKETETKTERRSFRG